MRRARATGKMNNKQKRNYEYYVVIDFKHEYSE